MLLDAWCLVFVCAWYISIQIKIHLPFLVCNLIHVQHSIETIVGKVSTKEKIQNYDQ
jgi:hypothetical protein